MLEEYSNALKERNEDLDQLTDELVQVFCFEDIEESSEAQKATLIQRIIKLGGDNYTYDDLRRDLMIVEIGNNAKRQIQDSGPSPKDNQQGKEGNMIGKDSYLNSQPCIINRIIKELEHAYIEEKSYKEKISNLNIEKVLVELGIQKNQVGLCSPNFGKVKGKRGRRSLKDLREFEGLYREQKKIDQLLNIGKGKSLPKQV